MIVARGRPGERLFLSRGIIQPRPVRGLLLTSEGTLRLVAAYTDVKVVIVWIARRRLMQHPGRTQDCTRRGLVADGVAKQSGFHLVRAEDPLHPRSIVENQRADEVPVAPVIELEGPPPGNGPPESVEAHPRIVRRRQTPGVLHEEQCIGVASGTMASVPRMRSSGRARQVADAERVAAGKHLCDLCGRALDRLEQRGASIPRPFARSKTPITRSLVGEGHGVTKVPVIRGANRDRLPAL